MQASAGTGRQEGGQKAGARASMRPGPPKLQAGSRPRPPHLQPAMHRKARASAASADALLPPPLRRQPQQLAGDKPPNPARHCHVAASHCCCVAAGLTSPGTDGRPQSAAACRQCRPCRCGGERQPALLSAASSCGPQAEQQRDQLAGQEEPHGQDDAEGGDQQEVDLLAGDGRTQR